MPVPSAKGAAVDEDGLDGVIVDQAAQWQQLRWSLQGIYDEQKSCLESFHALLASTDHMGLKSVGSANGEGSELAAQFAYSRFYHPPQAQGEEPGSPGVVSRHTPAPQRNHDARMKAFLRSSRQFSRTVLAEATSLSLRAECPKCEESRALGIPPKRGCDHHARAGAKELSPPVTNGQQLNTNGVLDVRAMISSRGTADSTVFKGAVWWEKLFIEEEYDEKEQHHTHHENHSLWIRLRYWCFCIASKKIFDYVMGLIILMNAVSVGLEVQSSLTSEEDIGWMYWLDFAFVMIYIAEFNVRLLAWGVQKCFTDPWCLLDFSLVVIGILSLVAQPLGLRVKELESLLVVRSLRLLRLIRALRLLKQFRTVWRLVNGLLTSANAMVSTLVLVVLTLYIAACLGIEIITKDTELKQHIETEGIVSRYFGTLPSTLLTLTAFVTLDSVAPIYVPLIVQKPLLAMYFFFIILFVSIALMNLVTAVLVEGALENATADKELEKLDLQEKLKNQMPRLLQIFKDIDKDGSGTLTMEEMSMVPVDVIPEELRIKSRVSSMSEVFEMLDVDGGGELTKEEFVEGLLNLFMQDVPIATIQTLRLLRSVDARVWRLGEEMVNMQAVMHGENVRRTGNRPPGNRVGGGGNHRGSYG